jgi:PAS domain S-box-containing protein
MDIRLKGDMDGIQAAQQIWDNLSIPVIYVTGHSDQSTLERAKVTAPFGYILKPIKERELYVAIETARERYEREQLLSAVLKGMGDGVLVVDRKHRVQFLNGVAECLTGWQLSEARDKELTGIFNIVDEQTQQPVDDLVTAALQQDTTVYLKDHTLLISKNGTTIPIGDSAAPIKDNKGAIVGVVLVFRDISSSRHLEKAKLELEHTLDELKRTQIQLIQSEKMSSIGQMAAAVVNEINNPVSIIYGNLPLARQYFQALLSLIEIYKQTYSNPTPEIEHLTEKIDLDFFGEDWLSLINSMQVAAERIQEIVLSLLSLSHFPQLDKLDLKPVNIHEGIDNTLRILRHRLRPEGKRPEIQVIKDYGKLPRVTCYGSQLNQVFMHLLNNAIDALETQPSPRRITIRTEAVSTQEPVVSSQEGQRITDNRQVNTDWVVIRIADNGCGMSEEVRHKIFDPFFTTKPVGYGTGLGLSISYQIIVDRHGGQLLCHSTPGQGTEFAIVLAVI